MRLASCLGRIQALESITYIPSNVFTKEVTASQISQLLYRSNILVLVGSSPSPSFPPTKLIIWDDHPCLVIGEISFHEEILAVKLRRERIFVIFIEEIFVYSLNDLKIKDIVSTLRNPKGLCTVNTSADRILLACPEYTKEKPGRVLIKSYTENLSRTIEAFDTVLACLELNADGSLLACASERGTLIKVFNTDSKELVYELRRGIDQAEIYSIAFHPTSDWIACSSDKGTIHIYSTGPHAHNPRSNLAFMKKMLPKYFESEWSYAQFKVKGTKTICCFAKDNSTIILLTSHGVYYTISYAEPGKCKEIEKLKLIEIGF